MCNIRFTGAPNIKHVNARQYTTHLAPFLKKIAPAENIETFCLLRNPLEWIESWYRYRTRDELRVSSPSTYTGNVSYSEFIEAYLSDKSKRPAFAALGTQYDFVRLHNGAIGVDHIFSLDNMDMVCEFLSRKSGAVITIPRKNVSPKLATALDKPLKKRLLAHFEKDIALYDFIKAEGAFHRNQHGDGFSPPP